MREGSATFTTLSRTVVLLVWSLFLFLALISIINLLQITYYPVEHRVSFERTIHIVLISDQLDSALVILFAALSCFFTFLAFRRFSGNKWLASSSLIILNLSALFAIFIDFNLALILVAVGVSGYIILATKVLKQIIGIVEALLVILCTFEAGSLIHWLLLPLSMPSGFTDLFSRFSAIEAQLFYAPADLTPIAMLILLFSFPLYAVINWLRRGMAKAKETDASLRLDLFIDGRILLAVAIFVTAFIASYPYLPSVNPTGKYVGTDIYYYSQWLGEMAANPSHVVEFAIRHPSSRPLFLLLLYYLKLLLKMPTIPFLEWIAVPIFCLLPFSVYCFGTVANGRAFAGLAALLSSVSINVVAGIYTAYYSNILALSLLYLALAVLVLSLKKRSYPFALISCIPSMLAIFIHPWTWAFLFVAICAFTGVQLLYIIRSREKVSETLRRIGPAFAFIATNIIADLLMSLLLAVPSATGISYELAGGAISLNEFFRLGFNLYFTFRFFAGGYFNSFSAIVSAIVGTWWLAKQEGSARNILLAWLSIGALPTLFVNFWVNERIFYDLPIQLLSAAGLCFGLPRACPYRTSSKMLLLLFVLLNLNYALRSVANLV